MTEITANNLHEEYPSAHALYSEIKSRTRNASKRKGLDNLWEVLRRQHVAKSSDFTIATIGAQTAELGGPSAQTIRNANGADYRSIINAFAKEAGGVTKGKLPKPGSEFEVALSNIEDRGTRHMVRLLLQENKSLRNENNLLKHAVSTQAPPLGAAPSQAPRNAPYLDSWMIEGIREFLSPAEMNNKGWVLNENGAIVDMLGNEIAPVGVHDALVEIIDDPAGSKHLKSR